MVETAVSRWGQPNGYVLGQEGGGAFIVGLRYGDGGPYTKNAGDRRVFWEGPSAGFDVGGDGARTMMLVYNLPATEAIYQCFAGIDGSAYFIGGFGMTALNSGNIVSCRSTRASVSGSAPISATSNSRRRRPGTRSDRRQFTFDPERQRTACPLLAQSGHAARYDECPLSGAKRTSSKISGCAA